jgi:hypothetical protein
MKQKLTVESADGSHQITVNGILQMTILVNGAVTIDLAGKHIVVDRDMPNLRLSIHPDPRFAYMAPELLADSEFVDMVLADHPGSPA